MKKLLTVGMATYDDYDGVYFSIQALRLYHDIFSSDDAEIIVIDNNPGKAHGNEIKNLISSWCHKNVKYIPYTEKTSTISRNQIFKNANGKYCVSMDCHVLFLPGSFDALIRYYAANPDCKDIIHGPLIYDNLKSLIDLMDTPRAKSMFEGNKDYLYQLFSIENGLHEFFKKYNINKNYNSLKFNFQINSNKKLKDSKNMP